MNTWTTPLRYHSDDRDLPRGDNDLVLFQGENGDWYLSVLPHGDKLGPTVRITTSGQRVRGLINAVADLYRALSGEPSRLRDFDTWMNEVQEAMGRDVAATLRADARVAEVTKEDRSPPTLPEIRERYLRCVYKPGDPADERRLQVHQDVWALIHALEVSEKLLHAATDQDALVAELVELRNDKDRWELRALSAKAKYDALLAAQKVSP